MIYFTNKLGDEAGISGDDINRRLRERRLGFDLPPTADWIGCKKEIRCIFPYQSITKGIGLDGRVLHVHAEPSYFNPDNAFSAPGILIRK